MDITEEEVEIIQSCSKSIPSDNRRTWVKSHGDNFDVPMGAYESAQVVELVGSYILDTLGGVINLEQVGIYRDDGVIFIPTVTTLRLLKYGRRLLEHLNCSVYEFK